MEYLFDSVNSSVIDIEDFKKELTKKFNKTIIDVKAFMLNEESERSLCDSILDRTMLWINDFFNDKIYFKLYIVYNGIPQLIFLLDILPMDVLQQTLEFEKKYILGDVISINVYDEDYNLLDNSILGEKSKNCIICGGQAEICLREHNHDKHQYVKFMNEKIEEYDRIFNSTSF